MEQVFGASGLMSGRVVLAPEVGHSFPLDQLLFQSMVAGDPVSVARKNETPLQLVWRLPMYLAGNAIPDRWKDGYGSLLRRVVLFRFLQTVQKVDASIEDKILQDEIGGVLVLWARSYQNLLAAVEANSSIAPHYPMHCVWAADWFKAAVTPFVQFISTAAYVKKNAEARTRWDELCAVYDRWCKDSGFTTMAVRQFMVNSVDAAEDALRQFGMTVYIADARGAGMAPVRMVRGLEVNMPS
jgi:phage/plasmid-associated DNA primase